MRDLLAVAKALADENRLRILAAVEQRELCLCQIVELLGLATSTVSRHAAKLQHARLVSARKDGRWTYFRISDDPTAEAAAMRQVALDLLREQPRAREDQRKLKQILKLHPEQLCQQQSQCKC